MRRLMYLAAFCSLMLGLVLTTSSAYASGPHFVRKAASVSPATATCSGDGCDNLDPIATNCADSSTTTVAEQAITGAPGTPDAGTIADVELRYSPTCGTNWARFTSFINNAETVATIERIQETGITYLKYCQPVSCYASNNGGSTVNYTIYTPMVYSPSTPARACGTIVSLTTRRSYKACVQL